MFVWSVSLTIVVVSTISVRPAGDTSASRASIRASASSDHG